MAFASMIYNTSETICRNRVSGKSGISVCVPRVSLEIKATDIISLAEDYLSDLLVYESLPVKVFRAAIGRNEEKDMVELQDQINEFEKELEEHGMQINNITMSAAIDGGTDEYALYSIVHYSLRTGGEQS